MNAHSTLPAKMLAGILILSAAQAQNTKNPADFVDPFIGVAGGGNVPPGPQVPFGMVRLGPDCERLDANSGYKEGPVTGFSHTHISGSGGAPKYGNVLVQAFSGELDLTTFAIQHESEVARVGYYATTLVPSQTRVELTATARVGLHRYTFRPESKGHLVFDLGSCLLRPGQPTNTQQVVASEVRILSADTLIGHTTVRGGWNHGSAYTVYFHATLSRPAQSWGTWKQGKTIPGAMALNGGVEEHGGGYFSFDPADNSPVLLKVGISFINSEKARRNLERELPGWDFEGTVAKANAGWNQILSRIWIDGVPNEEKTRFYTALYHTFTMPTDRTGENPRWQSEEPHFDDFYALWDTFRTSFPLFALIAPEYERDLLRSLIDIYRHEGWMPDARSGNDSGVVQGGSDCDMVIADAFVKGIQGVDYQTAYESMVKNAEVCPGPDHRKWGRGGVDEYIKLGYVPFELERSGNRTLEYAACDFATAQVAKGLGKTADYEKYLKRSASWRNIWMADMVDRDAQGFIIPRKRDGSFSELGVKASGSWTHAFYEADSWIYSFFVPHDVHGLIEACGGREKFLARLDRYFTNHHNISNEPGFLTHCLFAYAGRPDKTAEITRKLTARYNTTRCGIPGNDDSGAMSAWLIFNLLGFFPNAGQDLYIITTPHLPKAVLQLGNGKKLTILANNVSAQNLYIAAAKLNGTPLNRAWFRHAEIAKGGLLEFEMSASPTNWGRSEPPPR